MRSIFMLALLSLVASPVAFARGVCESDMNRYCLGLLQIGHKELNQCLMDHFDELSSDCQKTLPANAKERGKKPAPKKKEEAHAEASEEHAEH